jgi:hypothetical protein
MDRAAFKYQERLATDKTTPTDQQFLKIKLSDVLISSAKVEDATLKAEITGIVASAEQTLIGLLLPASTGDVISGSGVLAAGDTEDPPSEQCDPCPACGLAVVLPRSHQFLDLISQPPGGTAM